MDLLYGYYGKSKTKNLISISLSIIASLLLVTGIVYATTIGTDINTGGNLTVSGTATFSNLGTDMLGSINSSGQLVASSTPQVAAIHATSTDNSYFMGHLYVGETTDSGGRNFAVANSGSEAIARILRSDTNSGGSRNEAALEFGGTDSSGSNRQFGYIRSIVQNPTSLTADMAFYTRVSGAVTEVLRLSQSGFVGIGSTTPIETLSVSGSGYITGGLGVGLANVTGGSIVTSGPIGVATSSPSTEISATGSGTTTIYLNTSTAAKGTCVQLIQPVTGNFYRLYINTGGTLTTEAGSCK